jgi:hypothetical protein
MIVLFLNHLLPNQGIEEQSICSKSWKSRFLLPGLEDRDSDRCHMSRLKSAFSVASEKAPHIDLQHACGWSSFQWRIATCWKFKRSYLVPVTIYRELQ